MCQPATTQQGHLEIVGLLLDGLNRPVDGGLELCMPVALEVRIEQIRDLPQLEFPSWYDVTVGWPSADSLHSSHLPCIASPGSPPADPSVVRT